MMIRSINELAVAVAGMGRPECIRTLRALPVRWMDFSDEWFAQQSLDRLQHVTMAACVRVLKMQGNVTLPALAGRSASEEGMGKGV